MSLDGNKKDPFINPAMALKIIDFCHLIINRTNVTKKVNERIISVVLSQVEQSGTETAGSVVFRRFHGSSIPVNGSGDRIYPVPPGTDRNLSKPAAGYGYRISASNSWHFPAGSGRKRRVS